MPRQSPLRGVEFIVERVNDRLPVPDRLSSGADPDGSATPVTDVDESPTEYEVTVELPGFTRDEVNVRLVGQTLYVAASRDGRADDDADHSPVREHAPPSQSRRIRFTHPVDEDGVSATMHNGLLRITVPKASAGARGHAIDIS